jgi:hypothetical protein
MLAMHPRNLQHLEWCAPTRCVHTAMLLRSPDGEGTEGDQEGTEMCDIVGWPLQTCAFVVEGGSAVQDVETRSKRYCLLSLDTLQVRR